MDHYNENAVRTAGIISTIGVLFGVSGWFLTHKYEFMNIGAIIVGFQAIYFSRDLAMERVVRYNLNYKFARGMYIVVGLIFIFVDIIWLIRR